MSTVVDIIRNVAPRAYANYVNAFAIAKRLSTVWHPQFAADFLFYGAGIVTRSL